VRTVNPAPRRGPWLAGLVGLVALSLLCLPLGSAFEFLAAGPATMVVRAVAAVGRFTSPDLRPNAIARALGLAAETFAIALLGCGLAAMAGWVLALGASRAVVLGGALRPSPWSRIPVEVFRLVLDVLRGIPDFAWALLALTFTGPGALACVLAIAISVAGILGKIYSELWDAVPPTRVANLRSTGASPRQVLLYGLHPQAGRDMLAFTLLRVECAVRNASVVGVMGGGGLGAAIFDEFDFGNYDMVATLVCTLVVLTATTEGIARWLRSALGDRTAGGVEAARRRRRTCLGGVALLAVASAAWLSGPIVDGLAELGRLEGDFTGRLVGGLVTPDLGGARVLDAVHEARVPLATGFLATLAATLAAAVLSYFAAAVFQHRSHRITGERTPPWMRAIRRSIATCARAVALIARAIPEVLWLLLLALVVGRNATAALAALTIHSVGVLGRVFTETLDDMPDAAWRRAGPASRPQTWLYVGVPNARDTWRTYALFQLESNVRTSVALGMVGAGGLGFAFYSAMSPPFDFHAAGTYALTMVVLTVALDRCSRRLKRWQTPC